MDHAKPAEISVLSTEGPINNRDVLNQFGTKLLQRSQVSLPVTLRSLVLLNVVHQYFQAAIHAAMIRVESEAPDLERLPTAFVLAGVDAGV